MGGYGSGRTSFQTTIEQARRLDIRWLNKTGRLKGNHSGTLSWTRNGRDTGSISYTMQDDIMILNYRYRDRGGEWEAVEQAIQLSRSACHYGGERKWFLCPRCMSRVAVLLGHGKYYYCRHCYRLPYRSTLETKTDRTYTKKHELGAQIFENYKNGDGWIKKKGMHQKTFDKKLLEYRRLERQIGINLEGFFGKLGGLQ